MAYNNFYPSATLSELNACSKLILQVASLALTCLRRGQSAEHNTDRAFLITQLNVFRNIALRAVTYNAANFGFS